MDNGDGRMTYIALTEENKRFALDKNRDVNGSILISDKDSKKIISLKADNIKKTDRRMYRYKLLLLGLNKGKSLHIDLGEIKPDNKGQVYAEFELETENPDKKGNPLSCFFIFMIVAVSVINMKEPYHPVLKGDWGQKCTDSSVRRTDISVHKDQEAYLYKGTDQKGVSEQTGESVRYKRDPLSEQTDESVREHDVRKYNRYYDKYIKERVQELISRKDSFAVTVPFDEMWTAEKWYRVADYEEFPMVSIGARASVAAYGHFIFAFNDEYLVLGVPGLNEAGEQPDGGESGFTVWHHIKGSNQYGYWLVMIQRKEGFITEIS